MTFTYDLSTDTGKVRLRIGDTVDESGDSLSDEEIAIAILECPSLDDAAVRACEFLIAKLRKKVNRSAAGVNSSQRDKLTGAMDTLKMLRSGARNRASLVACAGQISAARNAVNRADSTYEQPSFTVGMDDYPGGIASGGNSDD